MRTALLLCILTIAVDAQVITTAVGTTWVFPAGSQPAANAPLGKLGNVAVDAAGNVFAADTDNGIVVKISGTTLTLVAGNGIQGNSGDGGPATGAQLARPNGIAVDAAGNLYIADLTSARIRKVDAVTGVISTIAGKGFGYSGDGGAATQALIGNVYSIAVDGGGNVYLLDASFFRIRKIDASGIITTFAGNGTNAFTGDGGQATSASLTFGFDNTLAVDASRNVYVSGGQRIRKITASGVINTFAGNGTAGDAGNNGPATSATLNSPAAMGIDASGNLYFYETFSGEIRKIDTGGVISLVANNAGSGPIGDGGSASLASYLAEGIAFDSAGNLYMSDLLNRRVRKIDTKGIISTVAGNGLYRASGDNGPATSAALNMPGGITGDAAGNLYIADTGNNRIRKVDSKGVITTIAGTTSFGFSGDGGPGVQALLSRPIGLALDVSGNLFIADANNFRIRKLTPGGVISTVATGSLTVNSPFGLAFDASGNLIVADTGNSRVVKITPAGAAFVIAGNGTAGFAGDGGQAVNAMLNQPQMVLVDAAGNIYVADSQNNRVRMITLGGVISTIAGNGIVGISGDGGPATSASIFAPAGLARDAAGNLYISDQIGKVRMVNASGVISTIAGGGSTIGDGGAPTKANLSAPIGLYFNAAGDLFICDSNNGRIREIPSTPPAFTASPASLQLSGIAGGASVTAQFAVSSTVPGLVLSATFSGPGISLSTVGTVTTPGYLEVTANPGALAAGTYLGAITVFSPLSSSAPLVIPITFTVATGSAATLQVLPASLNISVAAGGSSTRTLSVTTSGAFTASVTGRGLTISPASGSATPNSPASLQVTANSAGLSAGVYSGLVTVVSGTQTVTVPVTVSVQAQTQTILLSQTGLLFTAVEGGTVIPPQTFGIVNTGSGAMPWSVSAATTAGGNWLSVTPASGVSAANSAQVPLVEVDVNISGLKAGQYGGQVSIVASGANNSPQVVTVILNVMPAGSNPGVQVRPTGLIFVGAPKGAAPSSQNVQLSSALSASTQYASGLLTFNGTWAQAIPEAGTFSAAGARSLVVQPDVSALSTGVYRGALTLLFSDGSPAQVVNLLLVVTNGASGINAEARSPAAACTPTQILEVSRSLAGNFSSPVGWPTSLEIQVIDDCGTPRTDATVLATFSSGDAPIALASLGTGIYTGTWRPASNASQTTVTFRASAIGVTPAVLTVQGGVGTNVASSVGAGGVVNAASFDKSEVVAPGSIVSVFGSSMTTSTTAAVGSTFPLPTTLTGATLSIGGIPAPLFFTSQGQINAQVPFELPANSRPQVVLRTSALYAVPETITIDAARPGIFTINGTPQGVVVAGADNHVVDAAHPATAGDVVVVYSTGLGATNPVVGTNQQSPGSPAAVAVIQPTATIGGVNAPVQFAGLTPGLIGLYQVNVQVPAGVAPGGAVQLVLTQAGVASNVVTMGIK